MNGAAFVYHGMLPIRSDSKEAKVLIPYVRGVLDELQIKNGLSCRRNVFSFELHHQRIDFASLRFETP